MNEELTYNQQDVIARVVQGDEQAFKILYHHHVKAVNAVVQRLIRSDEVGELVQQVFILLWEKRALLAEVNNFSDYLFIMTRNKVVRHLDNLHRQAQIMQDYGKMNTEKGIGLDSTVEYSRYKRVWHQAINILPPQQKQVYSLIDLSGHSAEEVAQILNLARSTVNKHLELARRSVRNYVLKEIKEKGTNPDLLLLLMMMAPQLLAWQSTDC